MTQSYRSLIWQRNQSSVLLLWIDIRIYILCTKFNQIKELYSDQDCSILGKTSVATIHVLIGSNTNRISPLFSLAWNFWCWQQKLYASQLQFLNHHMSTSHHWPKLSFHSKSISHWYKAQQNFHSFRGAGVHDLLGRSFPE